MPAAHPPYWATRIDPASSKVALVSCRITHCGDGRLLVAAHYWPWMDQTAFGGCPAGGQIHKLMGRGNVPEPRPSLTGSFHKPSRISIQWRKSWSVPDVGVHQDH